MKNRSLIFSLILTVVLMGACKNTTAEKTGEKETAKEEQRIVSLNGAVTEIIVALGHGDELVGRDVTSTYPEWLKDSVKDLGHVRSLTMESIMTLRPTLLLASKKDMNPELVEKIKGSGIKFKLFDQEFSADGTKSLIKNVGDFIGNNKIQPLLDKIDEDLSNVQPFEQQPNVLFVYARGAGTMLVAGEGTPMESIIELAGGQNAVTGISDFKPLTEEALLEANPDVILLFDSGLGSLRGKEGFLKTVPAISQTNAGKNKAIISMDGGLLSGFGPRVGEAAYKLNELLTSYAK